MRLNKYIALCGQGSRRFADQIIAAGRISINGQSIADFSYQVAPDDQVFLDGKLIQPPRQFTYVMFHKPVGCLCTATDPYDRPTIYHRLPAKFSTLRYLGRLDFNSRGLLLLTDDGELLHRLTHPSFEVPRTYWVWTDSPMSTAQRQQLLRGVDIGEGQVSQPTKVKLLGQKTEITLTEGKNREIRRMMAALDLEVLDLKRVAYAGLELDPLTAGEYRQLTNAEIGHLYAMANM